MLNLTGFIEAVIARVKADSGAGGLWATGAKLINAVNYTYEGRTELGLRVATPYVTFDVPSAEQSDGFAHDIQEIYFRFHVWHHFARNRNVALTAASTIIDRLYGNALAAATRIPTYGFHRHTLVLTTTGDTLTPWATGICWRTSSAEAHEQETLHFIDTYRVNMTRVVAAS